MCITSSISSSSLTSSSLPYLTRLKVFIPVTCSLLVREVTTKRGDGIDIRKQRESGEKPCNKSVLLTKQVLSKSKGKKMIESRIKVCQQLLLNREAELVLEVS